MRSTRDKRRSRRGAAEVDRTCRGGKCPPKMRGHPMDQSVTRTQYDPGTIRKFKRMSCVAALLWAAPVPRVRESGFSLGAAAGCSRGFPRLHPAGPSEVPPAPVGGAGKTYIARSQNKAKKITAPPPATPRTAPRSTPRGAALRGSRARRIPPARRGGMRRGAASPTCGRDQCVGCAINLHSVISR